MAESSFTPSMFTAERPIQVHRKETLLRLDLECLSQRELLSSDMPKIMLDQSKNDLACALAVAIHKEPGAPADNAIYVIGPPDDEVVKIGVASCPPRRLAELNIGHWKPLVIHGLIWVVEGEAREIEREALSCARRIGMGRRGEWVGMTAAEACGLIADAAARTREHRFSDSLMWVRNRRRILERKREAEQIDRDALAGAPSVMSMRSSIAMTT